MKPLSVSIMDVTPMLAKSWLAKASVKNRRVNERTVAMYADVMRRGLWMLNGETIKLDEHEGALDGQHRLSAVIKSGCTIKMAVARNVQPQDIHTIDQGKGRTFSDTLTMLEESNTSGLAAAAKSLYEYERQTHAGSKPPQSALLDIIARHPGLRDTISPGKAMSNRLPLRPAALMVGIYLTRRIDADMAAAFEEQLLTGAGLNIDDPRLALREYARSNRKTAKATSTVHLSREHIAAYLKAWNHWISGKPLRMIRVVKNDYYAKPRAA